MLKKLGAAIRSCWGCGKSIDQIAAAGEDGEHPEKNWHTRLGIAGGVFSCLILIGVAVFPHRHAGAIGSGIFFIYLCFLGYLFFLLSHCPQKTLMPERKFFPAAGVIVLLVMLFLCTVLKQHGVSTSYDTQEQWQQILDRQFDDWHPVIHTFSLYLLACIYKTPVFVAGCWCLIFSVYCGWFYQTLRSCGFRWWSIIPLIIFMLISPVTTYALTVLFKDSAFMVTLLGIAVAMINIWYSRGEWLDKWYNKIILALLLVYAAFVRHNGIFFTVPWIMLLPLVAENKIMRRKLWLFSGIVLLLCGSYMAGRLAMIKHNVITQKGKEQSFQEAVGLPMSMMAHAYVNAPEKLHPEAAEFLSSKLQYEKWKEYYKGDYKSIKFNAGVKLLDDITPGKFAELFFLSLKSAPLECMQGFAAVTSVAWDPFWNRNWLWNMGFQQGVIRRNGWIFAASGLYCLILLILTIYLLPRRGVKVLFMSLPFIAYNYGTALLLSGRDQRFFWGVIIGSVPIITILLAECADNIKFRKKKSAGKTSESTGLSGK